MDPKIKICGITNLKDYNFTVSIGADYTGFIFYNKSPRYIDKKRVYTIIKKGINTDCQKVGVFVNENLETVRETYKYAGLDIVQLHGDESPTYCSQLGLPFWKAIRVKDKNSLDLIHQYKNATILLDTFSKQRFGGTGTCFDLKIAKTAINSWKRIIIAGGVGVKNIKTILELSPYAIDICSSVEERPGEKSFIKMKALFEIIKNKRCKDE